jgi:hypothetical protein
MDFGNRVLRPPLRAESYEHGLLGRSGSCRLRMRRCAWTLSGRSGASRGSRSVLQKMCVESQSSISASAPRSHKAPHIVAVEAIESGADVDAAIARRGDQSVGWVLGRSRSRPSILDQRAKLGVVARGPRQAARRSRPAATTTTDTEDRPPKSAPGCARGLVRLRFTRRDPW